MEGGDLLGPYERACSLAEQKAKAAGVASPTSAWHKRISAVPEVSPVSDEHPPEVARVLN